MLHVPKVDPAGDVRAARGDDDGFVRDGHGIRGRAGHAGGGDPVIEVVAVPVGTGEEGNLNDGIETDTEEAAGASAVLDAIGDESLDGTDADEDPGATGADMEDLGEADTEDPAGTGIDEDPDDGPTTDVPVETMDVEDPAGTDIDEDPDDGPTTDVPVETTDVEDPAGTDIDEDPDDGLDAPVDDGPTTDAPAGTMDVDRKPSSDGVSILPGDPDHVTDLSDDSWYDIFYDSATDTYTVTVHIKDDAEGNQTVDMTEIVNLLHEYAAPAKQEPAPAKPDAPGGTVSDEDMAAYEAAKAEYDDDLESICSLYNMWNSAGPDSGVAESILAEQGLEGFCEAIRKGIPGLNSSVIDYLMDPPRLPEPEIDEDSQEYRDYLAAMEQYELDYAAWRARKHADELLPAEVWRFEIYITSDSKHTYRYLDGSLTVATPDMEAIYKALGIEPGSGVFGFDGQELGGRDIVEVSTGVNWMSPGMLALTGAAGISAKETFWFNGEDLMTILSGSNKHVSVTDSQRAMLEELLGVGPDAGAVELMAGVDRWLTAYYSEIDGRNYDDLGDVLANSSRAKVELAGYDTNGRFLVIDGKSVEFVFDGGYNYDNFYQTLLSFAFGDDAGGVAGTDGMSWEEFLGDPKYEAWAGMWAYPENASWTSNGYQMALYYYMTHDEIWEQTNAWFSSLLAGGLTSEQATWASLAMAVNMDGKLSGDNWQLTDWSWYAGFELEQMDIDFTLAKTDGDTGEIITDSETEFKIWYVDTVTDGEGVTSEINMYVVRTVGDDGSVSYTFSSEESGIWTEGGELKIDYTLLKDIVYYLQEKTAPDGYELDPSVYVLMSQEDYDKLSEAEKAAIEGTFDKFLDMDRSEDGLVVNATVSNVKIVVPPEEPDVVPDEPDVTPDDPNPDEPGPNPGEPGTDPDDPDVTPDDPVVPVVPVNPVVPVDPNPVVPSEPETPDTEDVEDPDVPKQDVPVEIPVEPVGDPETVETEDVEDPDVPKTDVPVVVPGTPETPAGEPEEIDEPDVPLDDLPQTGQLWWPVPVLAGMAVLLFVLGLVLIRRRDDE